MTTRAIVPNGDGEGSLGTVTAKWGAVYSSDPASGENSGQVPTTAWVQKLVAATKTEAGVLPGTVTAFSGTFDNGYPVDKNTGLVNKEWHLCDGTNGTPDLRNRFIYGGDGTNNGATGGEASHKLTEAELPKIKGDVQFRLFDGRSNILGYLNDDPSLSGAFSCRPYTGSKWESTLEIGPSATSNTDVLHIEFGDNQPHNNMPPYYVLAYIMKL
ncbi:hypothetical protein [Acidaminococcus provencensis]|uniref:hypothetical protein n=1 Tax=Acidaminococcus provencensis TaxID=2058289 RepID=UPI0022E217B5|nr:hypothetical protein [Acidaminococcus provencensis]